MKIGLTGSRGYIGSRLHEKLVEKDYEVVEFDRKIEATQDLVDKTSIKKELEDCDYIMHLGAVSDVWADNEHDIFWSNVVGTRNIVEFCDDQEIPFTFTSSVSAEVNCNSYARSKRIGELTIADSKIDHKVIRLTNVVGGFTDKGQIQTMIYEGLKNGTIEVWGEGEIERGYISRETVVDHLIRSMDEELDVDTLADANMSNHEIAKVIMDALKDHGYDASIDVVEKQPPSPTVMTADDPLEDREAVFRAVRNQVEQAVKVWEVDGDIVREQIKESI